MDDQRIPARPLLRRKDLRHRRRIERIDPKSIHGLGGESHCSASAQQLRRAGHLVGPQILRLSFLTHTLIVSPAAQPPYTDPMQSAEIELKFPVSDISALQSRLAALGFLLETPSTFESNTLYDTPDRGLRDSGQILRLRQYGDRWTVTHKRHPDEEDTEAAGTAHYKVRIETETTVADGPALAEIFARMGYSPMFRYEKYRTEWSQDAFHLVIDETPIGTFAELEGSISWIDETLAKLGIDPATCLTESYGRLFLAWKAQNGSPVENLTFSEIHSAAVTV